MKSQNFNKMKPKYVKFKDAFCAGLKRGKIGIFESFSVYESKQTKKSKLGKAKMRRAGQ